MRGRSMMKWRVRRDSHCSPIEHDDIRRSIEVLDSVLAEFDDCLESWDTSPTQFDGLTNGKSRQTDINSNTVKPCLSGATEVQLKCQKTATDGSTSHFPSDIVPEQSRASGASPPPIPKRSPATKLSGDVSLFTFPTPDDPLDSHYDLSPNHVSQQRIRDTTLSDNNHSSSDKCRGDKCANCGRGLKGIAAMAENETSISPFHHRKQMFEAKIANSNRSPSLNRSYGTSFKRQQLDDLSNVSDESGFSELSRSQLSDLSGSMSPKISSSRIENGSISNGHHGAKCTCKDRIRQLNAKFSDVRRLLKLNKIRGLNTKPPTFVPTPPPALLSYSSLQQDKSSFRKLSDSSDTPKTTINDSSMDHIENESLSSSISSLIDFKLCNRCTSSLSIHTIEDLPKLLPTDALHRPHLGFSYSMEEDLPPGVKEIRQTSTPKDHVSSSSSPRIFRNKESNLSTFSHSANSLGYVSSQSDLELNDLSTIPDKVPMSSFKSRTLPNGLDRSPFYSGEEDMLNYEEDIKSHHRSTVLLERTDHQVHEPPPPEKTKTKHFRVFSRKVKKDKKKGGGTP